MVLRVKSGSRSLTIKQAIFESEKKLKSKGRLLVRPSGTEPVIRIMAESPDEAMVVTEINKLSEIIKNHN